MKTSNKVEEIKEKLAAIEHERWSDWQRYMHGTTYEFDANGKHHYAIPPVLFENWERQINTPYSELTDREKASDMEQVQRYWPLIEALIEAEKALVLEEVLGKLPGHQEIYGGEIRDHEADGFNQALDQVTQIIKGVKS